MIPMTLREAAINTKGSVIGTIEDQDLLFSEISTDSRVSIPDSLFIALKGENFDGHQYLSKAHENGAVACMLEVLTETSIPVLKVENTQQAMAELARSIREKLALPCIGITGSCGKTTVKEMIASILSVKGKVLATKGNFNNAIGVPLTLFRLTAEDQFAVIELGASKPGDIDEIAQLVSPEVALITNIGEAHLQGLGTIEGVAKVKGELLSHLQDEGTAVLEQDSPWLEKWKLLLNDSQQLQTFSMTDPNADYFANNIKDQDLLSFNAITPIGSIDINLPVLGRHNIANALAAMAAAIAVGACLEECQIGLNKVKSVTGRLQVLEGVADSRLIDDSYNANPASLKAAIEMLAGFQGQRILVLGDMAELGDSAEDAHFKAGQQAKEIGIDALYATGNLSKKSVDGFGDGAQYFESKDLLAKFLLEKITGDYSLLVKGSRSAEMEDIVKVLQKQEQGNQLCY